MYLSFSSHIIEILKFLKLHMHGPQPKAREGKPKRSGERGGRGMKRERWRELVGTLNTVNHEGLRDGER